MTRQQISTRSRFEIFKRDNFTCAYCGRTPPAVILHVDHIMPVSKGGTAEKINLITSCADCNLGKAANGLEDRIQPLADQIAIEKERAEQVRRYNSFLRKLKKSTENDFKIVSDHICILAGKPDHSLIGKAAVSVKMFLKRLPTEKMLEMADIADSYIGFGNDFDRALRYFYGCCWKTIRGEQ